MKQLGTVVIETQRLILRKFEQSDALSMFNNWASDEKVTEFLRWASHKNIDETKLLLEDWILSYNENNFYHWAIVLKENVDDVIGSIAVTEIKEPLNIVTIGYCLGIKWWNKGIMTEAFSEIIGFLFDKVKVNRIEARHDPNNPSSGHVMIKCGLQYEGTLRQADFNNKGLVDVAIYSLLAEEYYKT